MNLTVKIFQDFFTMNLTVVKFPYKEFFLALRALQNINEVPRYLKCSVRCLSGGSCAKNSGAARRHPKPHGRPFWVPKRGSPWRRDFAVA